MPTEASRACRMVVRASSWLPSPMRRATVTEKPMPAMFMTPISSMMVEVHTPMAAVAWVPMLPTMAVST